MLRLWLLTIALSTGVTQSARAQWGADPYGGHSVTGGVRPLGGAATNFDAGSRFGGRGVRQVQYPLDNRAYEGPDPATPSGYPMYAPGVEGLPTESGKATLFSAPIGEDDRWVALGQSSWEGTWVAGGSGREALGILTNDVRVKFESPRLKMITATPRLGWHLLDGPVVTDLPGQLYDASVETVLSLPLGETVFMQAAISPSIFTDGQNLSGDALRLPGRLLFFWSCTDTLMLTAGVVYLDRDDVGFLPSAGFIYKPNADWKIEMLIPRPRVAWRYSADGDVSNWLYVVGEFGGGSWAVDRANGREDVATLSDYRLLLGWERLQPQGVGYRAETGYVFNRSLEYSSKRGNRDLPATALVRFGLTY
ncbi:MAG: hypothetical protein ACK5Q5_17455 [Planctomycetaceae bacterium]